MAKGGQTPPEPGSDEVRAAWARKDAGDVAGARKDARRILAQGPSSQGLSQEDRTQAEDLLRATSTPRALYGFAFLSALILAVLLGLALTRYS
ncbi:molecular chaperone DnaJ [Corallococcus sp. CA053C]|uniref:molecular chaperone DnaJ n=1 Tax=Corallococcus sp. CA053C TaxID=2316732 RepID=UPI000EA34F6E|nr:molecular chaperone DnaJ [Corallococcus sp. CA053C]RKG97562.1 molecular chaperone DnaJ [Corallococcus sp. CA053C]